MSVAQVTMAAALLVALTLAGGAPSAVLDAQAAVQAATTVTLADGTFTLDQPVQVPPGATLLVRNATLYLDYRDGCTVSCQTPAILVESGATLDLESSRVDTHRPASDGPYVVEGEGARLVVNGTDLAQFGSFTFQLAGPSRSTVSNATFHDGWGPLTFQRGAEADVVGSTFRALDAGIAVRDSTSSIHGDVFQGIPGRAIDVQATVAGQNTLATMTDVEDNVVQDSGVGLLNLNGYPNPVTGNVFDNDTVGAQLGVLYGIQTVHAEGPVMTGNLFQNDTTALTVTLEAASIEPAYPPSIVSVERNDFVDTVCSDVETPPSFEGILFVDATHSWWGSPAGPTDRGAACPALSGSGIVASPWASGPV